jgi:hypothetical protein
MHRHYGGVDAEEKLAAAKAAFGHLHLVRRKDSEERSGIRLGIARSRWLSCHRRTGFRTWDLYHVNVSGTSDIITKWSEVTDSSDWMRCLLLRADTKIWGWCSGLDQVIFGSGTCIAERISCAETRVEHMGGVHRPS